MTYLAVFDSESWHLDNGVLARAAARDWPAAEVLVADPGAPGSEVRAVEVRYASAAGEVEVRSHVDGRCLYLDGPLELVADFVVWYPRSRAVRCGRRVLRRLLQLRRDRRPGRGPGRGHGDRVVALGRRVVPSSARCPGTAPPGRRGA